MPLRRELDIPVNPACQIPNRSDLWPCQQRLGGARGGCDSHPEPRTCSTCNGAGRRRDVYFDRIAHLLFTVDTRLHIPPRARVSGVRGAGHTRTHTFHISPREAGAALLPLFPSRPGTHSSSPSSHVTHAEMFTYLAWVAVRSYVRQTVLLRSGRPSCPLPTALPCCLRLRQWPEAMASPVA